MTLTAAHWTVDQSPSSVLVICNTCRARFLASSRPPAMRELADHLRAAHRGEIPSKTADNALRGGYAR